MEAKEKEKENTWKAQRNAFVLSLHMECDLSGVEQSIPNSRPKCYISIARNSQQNSQI